MFSCNWYISASVSDVLSKVVLGMADALRSHSRDIDLRVINAKDDDYKPSYERVKNFLAPKNIWHLFGKAPLWWKIVRVHSRTVHTLLEGSKKWEGYPSRFFTEGALSGEAVIFPVFDSLVSQSDEVSRAVFVRGTHDLPKGDYEIMDISDKVLRPEALSGVYFANNTGPREAMRAGLLTMRGAAVASEKSGYLDEILGPDGYFMIDENSDISRIIRLGLGERGRRMASTARHFLKSRRNHERCADSLVSLYRKVNAQ